MPSTANYDQVQTGPGRVHVDVVTAAAELYSSGASSVIANFAAVVSQALATPSSKTYTAGGGGDSSRVLVSTDGPFYVGDSGGDELQDLFKVVRASDDTDIFNPLTGQYVTVSSISPASIGAGFYVSNLTLNFNTPVPAGLSYKVYYSRRSTVGNLPVEFAANPIIRRTPNRVRFPEFDRDGFAPTSVSVLQNYVTAGYPDPYLAQWKAIIRGSTSITTSYTNSQSGAIGFVHIGTSKNVLDVNDAVLDGVAGAAFMAAVEKDIKTTTFTPGSDPFTKINSALAGTLTGNNQVNLNAADYFRLTGPDRTAIRLGVDMLKITFSDGSSETYVITGFDPALVTRATVASLGGAAPNFGAGPISVTIKWIRPTFFVGGAVETPAPGTAAFEFRGMSSLLPGAIGTAPSFEVAQTPPFYAAGTTQVSRGGFDYWNVKALTWGGYTNTGANPAALGLKTVYGELWGDGSIQSFHGRIVGLHTTRAFGLDVNVTQSYTLNPFMGSLFYIQFTGSTTKVLTLSLDTTDYEPQEGDNLTIFVAHADTGVSRLSTVAWPAEFIFSGTDGNVATDIPDTVEAVFRLNGVYYGGRWYFTRTDYEV